MSIKKGTVPPRYDEAFKAGAVKMVTVDALLNMDKRSMAM